MTTYKENPNYSNKTKHLFIDSGCGGSTRCDWNPCDCNLDACHFCHCSRTMGTTEKDDETCEKRTKEVQEEFERVQAMYHPKVPAIKGTPLKKENMVAYHTYLAEDYTGVPDCEEGGHKEWESVEGETGVSLRAGSKKIENEHITFSGKLEKAKINMNTDGKISCNKCIVL